MEAISPESVFLRISQGGRRVCEVDKSQLSKFGKLSMKAFPEPPKTLHTHGEQLDQIKIQVKVSPRTAAVKNNFVY